MTTWESDEASNPRIAQLEERRGDYERQSNDESLPDGQRIDARMAADHCRRMLLRLRRAGGVPSAERLLIAADTLADLQGRRTPLTLAMQRDALLVASLTDGLIDQLDRSAVEAAGLCPKSWERGVAEAIEMIRLRLRSAASA